jgi:hypothetical protein
LDTLKEIADALANNTNIGTIVLNNEANIATLQDRNIFAGNGLVGGGNLSADVTVNVVGGTGITVNPDNVSVKMSDFSTTDLAEGTNLYYTDARVESYISGGDGVDFASGNISVDNTVVRTSGDQSISGNISFTGQLVMPENAGVPTNNGSIYHNNIDVFCYSKWNLC